MVLEELFISGCFLPKKTENRC